MATKKQQRRRYERARAHAHGEQNDVEPSADAKRSDRGKSRRVPATPGVPNPPNRRRAARRALVFASLFLLVELYVPVIGGKTSPPAKFAFALYMFMMFWLIGLMTERWAWRRHLKQQGKL
jgi:hypothetical protein